MTTDGSWEFESEEEKAEFEETVTKENCGAKLLLVRKLLKISRRELARVIGVSEATLRRIEQGETTPTDEFMNRLQALCVIGAAKYGKLSDSEKEKVSGVLGATGGVIAGVGGSIAAIGAAGAVGGFSAAGITSGLAAIGGGAMLTGIGVVASIPIATGLLGYGLVKGIKAICQANNFTCTSCEEEDDERWEIRTTGNKED